MSCRVWFENANGERRVIKNTANTWVEVNQAIDEFIRRCNVNKTNARKRAYGINYNPDYDNPFIRYYTRTWEEDGMTKIDVGSHTEFFYWEKLINNEMTDKNGE